MSPVLSLCQCNCGGPAPIATRARRRYRRRDVAERFWSKVRKDAGEACWLWTASLGINGYGQFQLDGTMVKAHRVAWILTHGPIPPETPHVLHNCPGGDNPACVRHLWLGTHTDNMRDMAAKGRSNRGERHPLAKLSAEQVQVIRQRRAAGEPRHSIARAFMVSCPTVSDITRGRSWSHLQPAAAGGV